MCGGFQHSMFRRCSDTSEDALRAAVWTARWVERGGRESWCRRRQQLSLLMSQTQTRSGLWLWLLLRLDVPQRVSISWENRERSWSAAETQLTKSRSASEKWRSTHMIAWIRYLTGSEGGRLSATLLPSWFLQLVKQQQHHEEVERGRTDGGLNLL